MKIKIIRFNGNIIEDAIFNSIDKGVLFYHKFLEEELGLTEPRYHILLKKGDTIIILK